MQINQSFDARNIAPQQGGGAHPVGNKFPFTITNTSIEENKAKDGGMFCVELTSPHGSIISRYNLFNKSAQAIEIAQKELSALCHATGIFQLDFNNEGAALRNAKGLMDIAFQKGHEPTAEKPQGGYVELKKVYDVNGNEPGKAPAPQAAQPSQNGQAAQPSAQAAGWGGSAPNPSPSPAPAPTNGGGGWQPGAAPAASNGGGTKPPWS